MGRSKVRSTSTREMGFLSLPLIMMLTQKQRALLHGAHRHPVGTNVGTYWSAQT